jgi:hypothetical protein
MTDTSRNEDQSVTVEPVAIGNGAASSTCTTRRPTSSSPTACTAGSACPPARRTPCGARRWTPPRADLPDEAGQGGQVRSTTPTPSTSTCAWAAWPA